mgnify:CR=1 FL=1
MNKLTAKYKFSLLFSLFFLFTINEFVFSSNFVTKLVCLVKCFILSTETFFISSIFNISSSLIKFLLAFSKALTIYGIVKTTSSIHSVFSKGKNVQNINYMAKTKFRREKIRINLEYNAERIEGVESDDDLEVKVGQN